MIKVRGLVHTGLLGVVLATVGIVGCASGDSGAGQSGDNLTGDSVSPQCPGGGPDQSGAAKSFSARAVAVSVRVDIKNPSTTSWDGTAVLTDTKALPSSGGLVTKSSATVNGGAVAQGAAANAAARGKGGEASSTATVTNASLFHTAPDGFLKEILGEDGRGGTVAIDLQDLLESLGINDDLLSAIFTGPLKGGIQADVIQEDAKSWCDAQGKAHSSAESLLAKLVIGGTPIPLTLGPNQKILDLPGLVTITLNEQTITGDSGASSIDATAVHVNLLDGKIDVKVARAQAGVACSSGGGGGGGGCGPKR